MSVLVDAFVPPEGVYVACGDAPELWAAEPVRLANGQGAVSSGQRIAAEHWTHVAETCARCPLFDACGEYGLQPEHLDEPMVYGGMSPYMRQLQERGYVRTLTKRVPASRARQVPRLYPYDVGVGELATANR